MISMIMPYWHRLELLNRSLAQLDLLYPNLELEVIIADDGCGLQLEDLIPNSLEIIILPLPKKAHAENPCVPLNAAAAVAQGEFLCITNPEIIHEKPVLEQLWECVSDHGENHYCTAAVWSEDTGRWYNHTSCFKERTNRAAVPNAQAGLHFLAMMKRSFFKQIGGFDEVYRAGQGFEDNDFLWKLHTIKADFHIREDLVVGHVGTRTFWPSGGLRKNQSIFNKKWEKLL